MGKRHSAVFATLPLVILMQVLAGCITGPAKLHVSAENESGKDLAVVITFKSNSTGGETVVDLGVIPARAFGEKEKELSAGDYTVRAVAGGIEHVQPWTLHAGEQGLIVRISEASIQFIEVPGGG